MLLLMSRVLFKDSYLSLYRSLLVQNFPMNEYSWTVDKYTLINWEDIMLILCDHLGLERDWAADKP